MRYWMKYILFVCLISITACQATTQIKTEDSYAKESSSLISDIRETYALRLHQQLQWSDALASSYQIGSSSQENRLRTRRTHSISFGTRIQTGQQYLYAFLPHIEQHTAHYLNRIAAATRLLLISFPSPLISFPFHGFW